MVEVVIIADVVLVVVVVVVVVVVDVVVVVVVVVVAVQCSATYICQRRRLGTHQFSDKYTKRSSRCCDGNFAVVASAVITAISYIRIYAIIINSCIS